MNVADGASLITTAIILATLIMSGPVVPTVDFTTSPLIDTIAENEDSSLDLSEIRVMGDGPRINPGRYDWLAVLDAPTLSVKINRVSGSPFLVYELAVPGLSHNIATLVAIDEQEEGRTISIDIENSTLRADEIASSSYPAEIRVRVRAGNKTTTIFRTNATVTVEGFNDD
jgi:hypothetical protein